MPFGQPKNELLMAFSPHLPAPWIIFSVLLKLIFQCSLDYFLSSPCSLNFFWVASWLFSSATSCLDFSLCSQLPGCFDSPSPGSLKPHAEAFFWECSFYKELLSTGEMPSLITLLPSLVGNYEGNCSYLCSQFLKQKHMVEMLSSISDSLIGHTTWQQSLTGTRCFLFDFTTLCVSRSCPCSNYNSYNSEELS